MEEVIQSRQGRQQIKAKPPDSQGKESIQAIAWGADQWRKYSKYGREDREEFYMSTHLLLVDQSACSTYNIELHTYYRLQVEPRRR